MTDRELLELAAKAAGIEVWPGAGFQAHVLFTRPDLADPSGKVTGVAWNPLTDDGDALRLAVNLRISIDYALLPVELVLFVNACAEHLEPNISHEDLMAATRRAVVRAAAEIGKTRSD